MTYYIDKDELQAISEVVSDNILERYVRPVNSRVSKFEKKFAAYSGTKYALAVSSGTTALICSLKSIGIGYGDEVIIPAHTYVATALAVLSVGATPIIIDINNSLTIDHNKIEDYISAATKAVIVVHMYGLPCYMDEILAITTKHGIPIIEDVAQACGGSYKGRMLGSIGVIGAFSFNHYKMISSGEGGAIITNSRDCYYKSVVTHHGGIFFESKFEDDLSNYYAIGSNYRMSEIAGAILVKQLDRINDFISSLRYEKHMLLNKIQEIKSDKFLILPISDQSGECARSLFIKFDNQHLANKFLLELKNLGIDCFSTFSRGHTATCWSELLNSGYIYRKKSSNNFIRKKYFLDVDSLSFTDQLLKCVIGINMGYKTDTVSLEKKGNTILKILKKL